MFYLLPWLLQILSCHFRSDLSSVIKISLLKGKNSLESIVRHPEWSLYALPCTLIYVYQHWVSCLYIFQHSKERRREHQRSAGVQKHSWMTALSAKPNISQVRVPEHPACPKHHRYEIVTPEREPGVARLGLLPCTGSLAFRNWVPAQSRGTEAFPSSLRKSSLLRSCPS